MSQIQVVGLDLAKQVFQVHAAAADGSVVVKRQLRRSQVLAFFEKLKPCLVGLEACGSAHFWAREIAGFGHRVRLMPPAYVRHPGRRLGCSKWCRQSRPGADFIA